MNLLWKSDLRRSFTNSFFPFTSVPLAWFRNTTSSSHLRFAVGSRFGFMSGLPYAISCSRLFCSSAAFSSSSFAFRSALSFLIFSSSLKSSAVSSSSSSLSSSLLESSDSEEAASTSLVSSRTRLRFASVSSSPSSVSCPDPASRLRF